MSLLEEEIKWFYTKYVSMPKRLIICNNFFLNWGRGGGGGGVKTPIVKFQIAFPSFFWAMVLSLNCWKQTCVSFRLPTHLQWNKPSLEFSDFWLDVDVPGFGDGNFAGCNLLRVKVLWEFRIGCFKFCSGLSSSFWAIFPSWEIFLWVVLFVVLAWGWQFLLGWVCGWQFPLV